MSTAPDVSPGTVSKILWHFTGGPLWNATARRQLESPKPAAQAYANLQSILRTRELRVGAYKEIVKVILAQRKVWNRTRRKYEIKTNVPAHIESAPVCCVSDIPAPHLRYHSYRYGKFAIGFHRDAIIGAGFNPVLYTLEDTSVVHSIYRSFSALQVADTSGITDAAESIESEMHDLNVDSDDIELNLSGHISDIESGVESVESVIHSARWGIKRFAAFVKTFSRDEFSSIYCEREWRSTSSYSFDLDHVAMIVLPRRVSDKEYFKPFVERFVTRLKLPRRIPVVPWDDLIEH